MIIVRPDLVVMYTARQCTITLAMQVSSINITGTFDKISNLKCIECERRASLKWFNLHKSLVGPTNLILIASRRSYH